MLMPVGSLSAVTVTVRFTLVPRYCRFTQSGLLRAIQKFVPYGLP